MEETMSTCGTCGKELPDKAMFCNDECLETWLKTERRIARALRELAEEASNEEEEEEE